MNLLNEVFLSLSQISISSVLDILLMSLLIYAVLVWFKRTKAAFVLTGILIVSVIYVLARAFNLFLVASLLQGFFAVILVAVVVIFQEELRRFFEQVALWSLDRNPAKRRTPPATRTQVEIIARTLMDLARERIGALIVLRGRDALVRHLDGGVELNGDLSEQLLKSIFDPHSIGHDGAVVIENDRVARFSAHLPLSKDLKKLQKVGTRHTAALGLAELTDAMCLVVSEERGTISVARNGDIREVNDPSSLMSMLGKFYDEIAPKTVSKGGIWRDFFSSNNREKVVALLITLTLWFVFVHESVVIYRSYTVPVEHTEVPAEWNISEIRPRQVHLTFSGPRRAFFFMDEETIRAKIRLFNLKRGIRTVTVTASDLTFPTGVDLENIEPQAVKVHIEAAPTTAQ